MRRFLAPDLTAVSFALPRGASHHLLRVCGIAPGEEVELFDGRGGARRARLREVRGGRAILEVTGPLRTEPPTPPIWLLVGRCRAAVMRTVLRMATELGAGHIAPIRAERSVARGDQRARWERIISAALGQSGGARPPRLLPPMPLGDVLDSVTVPVRFYVPGGPMRAPAESPIAVAVGPEGGWSPAEVALAESRGALLTGLGPRTLRVDTAVAAALARIERT